VPSTVRDPPPSATFRAPFLVNQARTKSPSDVTALGVKEKIDSLKKLLLLPPPEYRLVIREEASEEEKQKIRQLRREQRIRAKEQEFRELQEIHRLNLAQIENK